MATFGSFAATLQLGSRSIVITAGQTIEIPISSSRPIAGDLAARGAFEANDVTFTPGPGCHLSAHDCTLLITAAPNSKEYTAVPVVVSESAATNTPVFSLSVIYPGESAPIHTELPKIVSKPIKLSSQIGSTVMVKVTNTTQQTLTHLAASQLPSGIYSHVCPTIKPGATCSLRLDVNDTPQAGYAVIALQSDQGILLDQILAVTPPTKSSKPKTMKPVVQQAKPALQRSGNALFYAEIEPQVL